jgi:hypothetical protein
VRGVFYIQYILHVQYVQHVFSVACTVLRKAEYGRCVYVTNVHQNYPRERQKSPSVREALVHLILAICYQKAVSCAYIQ